MSVDKRGGQAALPTHGEPHLISEILLHYKTYGWKAERVKSVRVIGRVKEYDPVSQVLVLCEPPSLSAAETALSKTLSSSSSSSSSLSSSTLSRAATIQNTASSLACHSKLPNSNHLSKKKYNGDTNPSSNTKSAINSNTTSTVMSKNANTYTTTSTTTTTMRPAFLVVDTKLSDDMDCRPGSQVMYIGELVPFNDSRLYDLASELGLALDMRVMGVVSPTPHQGHHQDDTLSNHCNTNSNIWRTIREAALSWKDSQKDIKIASSSQSCYEPRSRNDFNIDDDIVFRGEESCMDADDFQSYNDDNNGRNSYLEGNPCSKSDSEEFVGHVRSTYNRSGLRWKDNCDFPVLQATISKCVDSLDYTLYLRCLPLWR